MLLDFSWEQVNFVGYNMKNPVNPSVPYKCRYHLCSPGLP